MIGGFQASLRRVQQTADLRVFLVLEIAKLENGALYIRQHGDGLLQQGLRLVTVEVGICHQVVGNTHVFVSTHCPMVLLSAEEINTLIDGDTREPSGHL